MDAAEAARAHEADPDDAAGGERAADRRRADDALGDRGREVARADLARVGGEAAELVLRQTDAQQPVQHADRGGHPACCPYAPLALEPDLDAFAGRKAVRDERRLERDDRSPVGERVADLVRDLEQIHHGIEPSFATQRACGSQRQLRPADEVAGGERVPGAGRVEHLGGDGGQLDLAEARAERAALQHPLAALQRAAEDPLLVLVREHDRRSERLAAARGSAPARSRGSRSRRRGRRSRAARARPPGAPRRRSASAGASSREGGGACSRRARPGRARRPWKSGETPRSEAIVRAPSCRDERDDGAGAAVDDRPANLDAVALEPAGGDPAGLVVRPLADEARLPAELRHPRGDVRRLAAGPEPGRRVRVRSLGERLAEPDDHVQEQVAERDDHAYHRPMDGEHGGGARELAPSSSVPRSARQRPSPPPAGCARRSASARPRPGSLHSRRRRATASSSRASATRRSRVAPGPRARSSAG